MTTSVADAKKQPLIIITDQNGNITKEILPNDVQVGLSGASKMMNLFGGFGIAPSDPTNVSQVSTNNFQLANTDFAFIQMTSVGVTVNLPTSPTAGQIHIIKDGAGTASDVNIAVSSSFTIDGLNARTITNNYGMLEVMWNGTNWSIIGMI